MKHLLITTIAAVVLVGCGESQQSVPQVEAKPEPPDISIHEAAGESNIEAIKQHLAAGTDVNAIDGPHTVLVPYTPLHEAARKGHKEVVELLIAKGAEVNAKDVDGDTPLDYAIWRKRPETADLLRKHGGKTGEELKTEDISIHDAARDGNIEAVKQHLTAGADVNAKGKYGWTPLHSAATKHKEITELLIAAGAAGLLSPP
jgi:cytohesin